MAAIVAIASCGALWLLLGRPKIDSAAGPLGVPELYNGLRISLAIVAGLGAVIALAVAYRRQRFNEAQHLLAKVSDSRDSVKLFGERFKSASEQLGSTEPAIRLAGAYSLLNLAEDWAAKRQMCVDVLCGYLRMPFDIEFDDGELSYSAVFDSNKRRDADRASPKRLPVKTKNSVRQELQVRLAIQRGLAAHLRNPNSKHDYDEEVLDFWPGVRIDLFGATLCNFDFGSCEVSWADFRRAAFMGDAKFRRFCVTNEANFTGAKFFGGATFSGTTWGGHASFVDVAFARTASFAGATFSIDGEFNRATFKGEAIFNKAKFGAGAWFSQSTFIGKASFASAEAKDGIRLAGAAVVNSSAAHLWPGSYTVVDGKLHAS
ncbi:pentapeptide repeat-containing protein [Micromonospora sp. NPDC049799]|uniref:pentapeptide repeat-containing protein n=1 Tax=Micromonospora sp. NPDC049799 TaxID=3154741 RepID=UPI0033C443C4